MNRRANYTVLAGLAELMMPKAAFPGVWPGISKFAKFPTLKNDPRNSVWKRSVTRNTLATLKSITLLPELSRVSHTKFSRKVPAGRPFVVFAESYTVKFAPGCTFM